VLAAFLLLVIMEAHFGTETIDFTVVKVRHTGTPWPICLQEVTDTQQVRPWLLI
jgi:hypothetical protein